MAREYKDSGIEWIGLIPKEWKVARAKSIFSQRSSKGNTTEVLLSATQKQGMLPQYMLEGVVQTNANTDLQTFKTVHQKDYVISLRSFQGGFEMSNYEGVCSPAYQVFYNKVPISHQYFWLLFKSYGFIDKINSLTVGIREGKNIQYKDFANMLLAIPSFNEQQKIADYLDKVCGEVDEMVALQETMIEELKAYKQSVITEAVTKGLNPNVPMRNSGIDWIGEIPEHWDIVPIKYIKANDKNAFADGPFGSNLKSEHFIENGDVIVIESGNITTGKFVYKDFKTISMEHFETIRRSECKANDVIIAKIGANYGMAGILPLLDKPSVVSGNSLKITLDDNKMMNSIFVYLMMSSKWNNGFKGLVQENAQPALSLSGLNNFRMPHAPLSEQRAIASYLDTKCSEIDSLIALKQAKIEELKEYKKSVIYEYVTGKKEVI